MFVTRGIDFTSIPAQKQVLNRYNPNFGFYFFIGT
jgi:hypothetical protein